MTNRLVRCSATTLSVAVLALTVHATTAGGQSGLESAIQQYSATSIEGYIQPLADVLVANLSRGYVSSVGHRSGFNFSVELVGMAAALDDKLKMYTASTPPGFQPATFQTPTIFGGSAPTVGSSNVPGLSYRGSDGLVDADYFPSAAPQLRVGGFLGTEVVLRYASSSMVPFLKEEDFPKLTILGVGVQHSISQYFPDLLIDVAVSGSYNSLKFGDIVDLSGVSLGVHAGKDFGLLGVFAGVASEGGSMKLTYTSTDPVAPGSVNLDLDAKRELRFTGGASLSLGPLHVFGDATFGNITTYSAGLKIGR